MDKRQQLFELAQKRKRTRWAGYKCIGDYHSGFFECDFVSPYTIGASNVDSDIMMILQDWSSDEVLSRHLDPYAIKNSEYGHDPSRPTNINLKRLLKEHFGVQLKDIYATNLFPFIKYDNISSRIPQDDLVRADREFALPQIKIVKSKLIVCLGIQTFNAIRHACGYTDWLNLDSAIASPFQFHGSRIWCQAHTSRYPSGGADRVSSDWKRMKNVIFR